MNGQPHRGSARRPAQHSWLPVDASGAVWCVRREAAIDLDACAGCIWLVDIDRSGDLVAIRCTAARIFADHRAGRSAAE